MITITSSWGTIICDDKGNVIEKHLIEYDGDERCYLLDASIFDLLEWDTWYEHYTGEDSPQPSEFDALEVGFWDANGEYNPADYDWRSFIYRKNKTIVNPLSDSIRLVEVNTTAWEEENFKLVTTLSDEQIVGVINPIIDRERNGGDRYTNNELWEALRSEFPNEIVNKYELIKTITI